MTAQIVHGMPEADYHDGHRSSLSHTAAKRLLMSAGPARFQAYLEAPRVAKPEFDLGSAAHALLLGVGSMPVDMGPDDWRSKEMRERVQIVRDAGEIPLKTADYRAVEAMAEAAKAHPLAAELLADGRPEVSLFATDPETGVVMRGRIDWLTEHVGVDYKTTTEGGADPATFAAHAVRYGYDLQAAWYLHLAELCGLDLQSWAWIVQEKTAPYLASLLTASEDMLQLGRQKMRRALRLYADCMASGEWPGYETAIEITPPAWALRDLELDDQLETQLTELETAWRKTA